MDTLYTLCRSADNRCCPPLSAEQARQIAADKRAYFVTESEINPLVREILSGGSLSYYGLEAEDPERALNGPATFFRTHEILRRTRAANRPIRIGGEEYPHDVVADFFARCVPNARLHHVPWFSAARYSTSVILVWAGALLISHFAARDTGDQGAVDGYLLYHLGVGGTIAALACTSLMRNRSVRRGSPWNSAMYLDLNADLIRRNSPALALARKEFLPRQRPFKNPAFYYPLARRIESHGFDDELTRQLGRL